ncbi:MAG: tRNA 2-thiouridine(34) synthase MnmA [Candidatus Saccharibacteria bacterium]
MKNAKRQQTVVVGMSGGVDSSVTAALLKKRGFDVVGVFMKNWSQDFGDYGCTWAEDAEDARLVADVLKIPFYVWNFEKEYYDRVVEYFLREYKAGRTPNPDAMCNKEIKFKAFLDKALKLGADMVATGHYARIEKDKAGYRLLKGVDPAKDQSYFLYTLKQEQLAKTLFPIGGYFKPEIRKLAKRFGLPNHAKKDSQGICFIGKIDVTEFLRAHIKAEAGEVVTASGRVVGRHYGLPFYTIGQRDGIGIGGTGPYYVVAKKSKTNQLVVTNDPKDKKLWRKEFTMTDLTWTGRQPKFPLRASVVIRYHHPPYPALLGKPDSGSIKVTFDEPQRAITPGQAAVVFHGDELLGGGVIKKVT